MITRLMPLVWMYLRRFMSSQQLVCVAHFTPPANTPITFAEGAANGAHYDIILLAIGATP
ncbi:MAG: hypothetical protein EBV69_10730 [Oxalobacteraceae bacterium]|jgi:hypothetical protein|nr:hypothetical protein [Oxalobacteraceae bacterium]